MKPHFAEMTNEQYHAHPSIGSTTLRDFRTARNPREFRWAQQQPRPLPYDEPEGYRHGNAVHWKYLEPEKYSAEVVEDMANKIRGEGIKKEVARFKDEINSKGLTVVDCGFLAKLDAIDALLRDGAHETARGILEDTDSYTEQSYFWTDTETGLDLKCRPDKQTFSDPWNGWAWDLKYCSNTGKPWPAIVLDHGYHIQAVHYLAGLEAITGEHHQYFGNIVFFVPPKGPVDIAVYEYPPEWLELGWMEWRTAATAYAECYHSNLWPGEPDEVQTINMPGWVKRRMQDE